ncbi:MAG: ketoacyl-ACP synthase III [Clostridia bacterium]|nr:ketoacyl-ACP synthase III [Clostridia bacterium]MDD4686323.1 ketoacyl-ACP synthase III [Clostridia bacterium]
MNKINVKIVSTGHYVPEKCLTNEDLEKMVDTDDKWIYSRTGIKNRHIIESPKIEDTSDLACKAALDAINKANYDVNKIDLIITATFTPDYRSPSVANLVQAKLGLSHKEIPCFDINAACTGFIYALNVASQMLNSGKYKGVLVIGAEVISKFVDYTNRDTCVLFGDGAGAVILEQTLEDKPAYFYTVSQGELDKLIYVDEFVHMKGKEVYLFATSTIEKAIKHILNDTNMNFNDIKTIIPHQANLRIIQSVAKKLELDMSKFFINIEKYGNTSAASVAIALDEFMSTPNAKPNDKVLLVGFGGGFTYGATILTI